MEHTGQLVLVFLILCLLLGAGARYLLRGTRIPYTVALLLIGMAFGAADRAELFHGGLHMLSASLRLAAEIEPHLILALFLPTLLFESAFSLDVHLFRRTLAQVFVLAVPGLLISTVAIAGIAQLFPWDWSWYAALMFGALLSATDPVAVVALLKELGAGKRLATLIEGESLLNDGTAAVVFTLFYAAVISGVAATPGEIVGHFLVVSIGGLAVGVVIGWIAIGWVRRVFNDALVEITVTISAAYLTFFVAESLLHVSGILAIVALGLMFAGVGRTRISPEVEGFLEHFWHMMAFLANTLIFILVGVVIAEHTDIGSPTAWVVLAALYAAIHVVRFGVNAALFPILRRSGYGLSWQDNIVLGWGGLRGAVGLALALIVAQDERVAGELGGQVLFLCAGIVVLTLVVNGSTMRALVEALGMTRIDPARRRAMRAATRRLGDETEQSLALLKDDRFLGGADWEMVRTYLPSLDGDGDGDDGTPGADDASGEHELAVEVRRRVLEAEKRAYWRQFHEGILGPTAVRRLRESADHALDRRGPVDGREDLAPYWRISPTLRRVMTHPVLKVAAPRLFFGRLSLGYDVARGFIFAQGELSDLIDHLDLEGDMARDLRAEIGRNRETGLQAVTRLKQSFPELVAAIETRAAARTLLNQERAVAKRLHRDGLLDEEEHARLHEQIEASMKRLFESPPEVPPLEPKALLREVPWMGALPDAVVDQVLALAHDRVYAHGEDLVTQGGAGDGMFVIVRGTARVLINLAGEQLTVGVLGPGAVIGEMAVLTGHRRTATVRAETPVAALWLGADELEPLLAASPRLRDRLWHTAGARYAQNLLARREPWYQRGRLWLRRWLLDGEIVRATDGRLLLPTGRAAVLLQGRAEADLTSETCEAPCVVPWRPAHLLPGGVAFLCPPDWDELPSPTPSLS